jgi:hypothetical protein
MTNALVDVLAAGEGRVVAKAAAGVVMAAAAVADVVAGAAVEAEEAKEGVV